MKNQKNTCHRRSCAGNFLHHVDGVCSRGRRYQRRCSTATSASCQPNRSLAWTRLRLDERLLGLERGHLGLGKRTMAASAARPPDLGSALLSSIPRRLSLPSRPLALSWACYLRGLSVSEYGRYFEDLEPGQTFSHWPGRTITEFDDTMFSLLSMNQHPVHIDAHFAAGTQHGQRLVEGPIVISLVIGMSQADIGGRATQTLEYSGVRHTAPVFHGDTIYAESTILDKSEFSHGQGVVRVEHRGRNQREDIVLTMLRKIVVPKRPSDVPIPRR